MRLFGKKVGKYHGAVGTGLVHAFYQLPKIIQNRIVDGKNNVTGTILPGGQPGIMKIIGSKRTFAGMVGNREGREIGITGFGQ